MKVLVINGSPKGEAGNTIQITNTFLKGMRMVRQDEVETVTLADRHIEYCLGCFACWRDTEHACVIHDDMDELLGKYREAEVVIWTTPVHTFGMSAMMKSFLDRLFPLHTRIVAERDLGDDGNASTTRLKKKHVLITSCGFYSFSNNVEVLEKHFQVIAKGELEEIVFYEGTLLGIGHPDILRRVQQYMNHVRRAGKEFAWSGHISEATKAELNRRLYSIEDYHILVSHNTVSWDSSMSEEEIARHRLDDVIHCMGVMMDRERFTAEPGIAEYNVTDLGIRAQLHMKKDRIRVVFDEAEFLPYHVLFLITSDRLFQLNEHVHIKDFSRFGDTSTSAFHGTKALTDRIYRSMKSGHASTIRI